MNLTRYLVDEKHVGDCSGHEKVVANNINRTCRALDAQIGNLLLVGEQNQYDPGKYHEIMSGVWPHWRNKKDVLLNLTEDHIQQFVDDICAAHAVVVCDKNSCVAYKLSELKVMSCRAK